MLNYFYDIFYNNLHFFVQLFLFDFTMLIQINYLNSSSFLLYSSQYFFLVCLFLLFVNLINKYYFLAFLKFHFQSNYYHSKNLLYFLFQIVFFQKLMYFQIFDYFYNLLRLIGFDYYCINFLYFLFVIDLLHTLLANYHPIHFSQNLHDQILG